MLLDFGHHLVDMTQFRRFSGGDHHAKSSPGANGGAREQQVFAIAQRQFASQGLCRFVHNGGFAGQDGLFNPQIMGLHDAKIGGNTVTRAQYHDIADDQIGSRDRLMLSVTDHDGGCGEHIADAFQRFFRVVFLNMANQGVDHRDAEDDGCIHPVPHDGGEGRCGDQDIDQNIVKMGQKA